MAHCEFRVSIEQAARNAWSGDRRGAIVSARDPQTQLCQVKLDSPGPSLTCELPNMSTEDCPIAQFKLGNMTFLDANARLSAIFDSEPKPTPQAPQLKSTGPKG